MTITHLMAAVAFDAVLITNPWLIVDNSYRFHRAAPDAFHAAYAVIGMNHRPGRVLVDQFKDEP